MKIALLGLATLLAATYALPARCAEPVLTNQPPATSIVRFEAARMPPKGAVWRQMTQADGEFVLSAVRSLKAWNPKWEGGGTPGCTLSPPNDFEVRAVTRAGGHYYLTFTTRAELVWAGNRLLEVPSSTSTQILQRVERALKKK